MTRTVDPSRIGGIIRAPASKSAMQRALGCAAMANGSSTIRNPNWCADSLAAEGVITALGVKTERSDDKIIIHGGFDFSAEKIVASCGESGLCIRMFSAIGSLLPCEVELRGEGTLASRSVGMAVQPLAALGVRCVTENGHPPIKMHGPLKSGIVDIDGSESSQFVTGLLMALPMCAGDSTVRVRNPASRGYLDLTLDVMKTFGAHIVRNADFTEFRITGKPYAAADYEVEGDWSGAAFLLVAGAIAGGGKGGAAALEVLGISDASSQPDRAIMKALHLAGANAETISGGYRISGAELRGFEFDASDCPDLFPPLVALASRCEGATRLKGATRLAGKESDRAAALAEEFGKLGLEIAVRGDEMTIRGKTRGEKITGGTVSSRGDHRIAMAAAVAALRAKDTVLIEGSECVAKSYPDFFKALDSVRL